MNEHIMRKPRLTDKVLRGIMVAVNEMCAGDLDDLVASEIIESASDVDCAENWVHAMTRYRAARKAAS
jgi:hypothetical protein